MNILDLSLMVSTAFIFILFVTGSWKKSYSTSISVIGFSAMLHCIKFCGLDVGLLVGMIILFLIVARAILLGEDDRILRGRDGLFNANKGQ
jgi:predicted branched-subunit amino acid permease